MFSKTLQGDACCLAVPMLGGQPLLQGNFVRKTMNKKSAIEIFNNYFQSAWSSYP